jgi:hypothetical protein
MTTTPTLNPTNIITLYPLTNTNLQEQYQLPPTITLNNEPPTPHHHQYRILNPKTGDDRLTWDTRDFQAMQDARKTYLDLIQKGYKPFKVDPQGKKTNQPMITFDPTASQVIFVPMSPVIGG